MTMSTSTTILLVAASLALAAAPEGAEARVRHRTHRTPAAEAPEPAVPQQRGTAGYFGPGAYGPFGPGPFAPGYGYGWYGPPRGDLGFALLGALNGGGFRGFVECGNYYARYPGACGF